MSTEQNVLFSSDYSTMQQPIPPAATHENQPDYAPFQNYPQFTSPPIQPTPPVQQQPAMTAYYNNQQSASSSLYGASSSNDYSSVQNDTPYEKARMQFIVIQRVTHFHSSLNSPTF